MDKLFTGKNQFVYWFGTVVDNNDPMRLGRCRVRIVGFHSTNEEDIPDDTLPWAYPITPITNAGIGGIGITPVGPLPNTRVFGFFLDGETGQSPMMLGVVSGISTSTTEKKLADGSTPQQPNTETLVGVAPSISESDCPDGYQTDTFTVNLEEIDTREIKVDNGEWVIPCTGFVSSAYGPRAGRGHYGVDICTGVYHPQTSAGAPFLNGKYLGPVGIPVYAAADGEVVYRWTSDKASGGKRTTYDIDGNGGRSYGNAIAIRHKLSSGTYTTIYAHLGTNQDPAKDSAGAGIFVNVGDVVKKGQQIGTVGRTHCRESPTHLHFEIRLGDALPRASNHINPGKIFPQLLHEHTSQKKWLNNKKYTEAVPYTPDKAPVISGQGPRKI